MSDTDDTANHRLPPPPRAPSFPPTGRAAITWAVSIAVAVGAAIFGAQSAARREAQDEIAPVKVEVSGLASDVSEVKADVRAIRRHLMGKR